MEPPNDIQIIIIRYLQAELYMPLVNVFEKVAIINLNSIYSIYIILC